jgi:hypothetical protein
MDPALKNTFFRTKFGSDAVGFDLNKHQMVKNISFSNGVTNQRRYSFGKIVLK